MFALEGIDQTAATNSSSVCEKWIGGTRVVFSSDNAITSDPSKVFIGLKESYGYWSVKLKGSIRFYYAIVERGTTRDSAECLNISDAYTLEDVTYLTSLSVKDTQTAPPQFLLDSELCSFNGEKLEIKSLITCNHGDPHRLTRKFIIVAGENSPGLVLRQVQIFGIEVKDAPEYREFYVTCRDNSGKERYPLMVELAIYTKDVVTEFMFTEIEIYEYNEIQVGYFKHNGRCVATCPDGYLPDNSRRCVKCNGVCKRWCDFSHFDWMNTTVHDLPTGCTHIRGHLVLYDPSPTYHVIESVTKYIERVTGVLVIIFEASNNVNLTPLLRNLKTIAGEGQLLGKPYCSSNRILGDECMRDFSLIIKAGSVTYLGINSLEQVHGAVLIDIGTICTITQVGLVNMMRDISSSNNNNIQISSALCSGGTVQCSQPCNLGCQEEPIGCYRCPPHAGSTCKMCTQGYQLNNTCVSTCDPPLYLHTETNECFICHNQCAGGCFGSLDTECNQCKNYRLRNRCVQTCPDNTVPDNINKICLLCVPNGCTIQQKESERYTLNLTYDGEGVLSWTVEFDEIVLERHQTVENFLLYVENVDSLENRTSIIQPSKTMIIEDAHLELLSGNQIQVEFTEINSAHSESVTEVNLSFKDKLIGTSNISNNTT
ncbi:ERBB2 [Bugula neritina]|uniref:ERBB2 n=1 Tax=Bugula neritina TaxID=10212 RepID=A0A7J7K2Q4_BUGNE|nr:ERBB2 [Bugula neritina]